MKTVRAEIMRERAAMYGKRVPKGFDEEEDDDESEED